MRFFSEHFCRSAARGPKSSLSRPAVAGAAHDPAVHEDCERERTDASTLKRRESCGITKYVRLTTLHKERNENANSAVTKLKGLETWGEKVNGATTASEENERAPLANQAGTGIDHGRSRDNTAAASGPYQNTGTTTSRNPPRSRTNVRCAAADAAAVELPDDLLFAPYQPVYRPPYDLTNPFDRTNLAIVIRGHIDRCEDYISLICRLHQHGLMTDAEHWKRGTETNKNLRRSRQALERLFDISGGNL